MLVNVKIFRIFTACINRSIQYAIWNFAHSSSVTIFDSLDSLFRGIIYDFKFALLASSSVDLNKLEVNEKKINLLLIVGIDHNARHICSEIYSRDHKLWTNKLSLHFQCSLNVLSIVDLFRPVLLID